MAISRDFEEKYPFTHVRLPTLNVKGLGDPGKEKLEAKNHVGNFLERNRIEKQGNTLLRAHLPVYIRASSSVHELHGCKWKAGRCGGDVGVVLWRMFTISSGLKDS